LWELQELKELVPKFKKKYFMVKQYRALREARILKKQLGYTIKDMGHATVCIKVLLVYMGTNIQTDFYQSKVFRSFEDFEWLFKTVKYENPIYFSYVLPKSKFFVDVEKNVFRKEKIEYFKLIFENLMVYRDLLEGKMFNIRSGFEDVLEGNQKREIQKLSKEVQDGKEIIQ
jgi:hypothetical protein